MKDINQVEEPFFSSDIGELRPVGNILVFPLAHDLWTTDGTAGGTRAIAPLPGRVDRMLGWNHELAYLTVSAGPLGGLNLWRTDGTSSGTLQLTALTWHERPQTGFDASTGRLFFAGFDAAAGTELWVSDGTASGTHLVRDLEPGPQSSNPRSFRIFAGKTVFSAFTTTGGSELWITDGTAEGTRSLRELTSQDADLWLSLEMTPAGDRLFYWASDPEHGIEPWVTDGTAAGTHRVADVAPGSASSWLGFALLPRAAGVLFLANDGVHGDELWVTDGTARGTRRLTSFERETPFDFYNNYGTAAVAIFDGGGRTFLEADDGLHGRELWTTDGTPGGTRLVADLCPGPCSSYPSGRPGTAETGFFTAYDPLHGGELWATDGSPGGTHRVSDICPGACDSEIGRLVAIGDERIFTATDPAHGREVWATDGSPARTRRLTDLTAEVIMGSDDLFNELHGMAVFPLNDGVHGQELWRSDLTPEGTVLLKDITLTGQAGASPASLTEHRDEIYFVADDGILGDQLWRSEGTEAGTTRLTEIPELSHPLSRLSQLTPTGPGLFFIADRRSGATEMKELWVTEGTPESSHPVRSLPTVGQVDLVGFGDHLFYAKDGLFRTDGTEEGTILLASGEGEPAEEPGNLTPVGDLLLYGTKTGALWRTDGTPEATEEVLRLAFPEVLAPHQITPFGAGACFFSRDSALWCTDGTAPGTFEVRQGFSQAQELSTTDERLFFTAVDEAGWELWTSDGTRTGTFRLTDLAPGPDHSSPWELTTAGGLLFFTADDGGHGRELWRSDGTPEGTFLLADILPGPGSSWPTALQADGEKIYFTATAPGLGAELWESDGTAAGTRLVVDLMPGPTGSDPGTVARLDDRLLFAADHPTLGRELWALPLLALGGPCAEAADSLCLLDGRVRLRAEWRTRRGREGAGHGQPFSDRTGFFWFFDPEKVELIVKVLDGTDVNGHLWAFYGALSDVEYWVEVSDLPTGQSRLYHNSPGEICGLGDIRALPEVPVYPLSQLVEGRPGDHTSGPRRSSALALPGRTDCASDAETLCLLGGRFSARVSWRNPRNGRTGFGHAVPGTDESGYFWFFSEDNLELVVKLVDGREINDHFWVFYGALSDVEYTIDVTDTETGAVRSYTNPAGEICGNADIRAFEPD